jgi:hypothetical protein
MQRKLAFLFWALSALMAVNHAFAQSSHDAASGTDPDLLGEGGNDFGISTADGKYRLRLRGHVQENNEFSYLSKQEAKDFNMTIKRARLSLTGNAIDPRLTYLFQVGLENDKIRQDLGDRYVSPGSHYLRDYYINLALNERYTHLRIGKFKTPFSRQQLMSTSQMQFFDQSHANEVFQLTDTGRDVGLMFHNGFNNEFEYALAAVSNGIVLRGGYNYGGIDGYDMVDFSGGGLRFAVAANGFLHNNYKKAKFDDARAGVDFVVKYDGLSTNGAFYYQYQKKEGAIEGVNNVGAGIDAGYLLQRKYEPVLRYSWVKNGGDHAPHAHEVLAGFNYYVYGHHLKAQAYAGALLTNKDFAKWLGGVQFQFAL